MHGLVVRAVEQYIERTELDELVPELLPDIAQQVRAAGAADDARTVR